MEQPTGKGCPPDYGVMTMMAQVQADQAETLQTHAIFLPPGENPQSIHQHHRSCALRHGGTACTC